MIQLGCRKWEELPAHQREADLGLQATAQVIGQLVCSRGQWPGALQTVVAATEAAREIRLGGGYYPTAQLGLLLAWILSPWITRKMFFSRCGSGGRERGGRGRDPRRLGYLSSGLVGCRSLARPGPASLGLHAPFLSPGVCPLPASLPPSLPGCAAGHSGVVAREHSVAGTLC